MVWWLGLALGLALCYRGELPSLKATGLLLFGALALARPDLALLFVPLTAPLFLTTLELPGMATHAVPPHELALLTTAAATTLGTLPTLAHKLGSAVLRNSVPITADDGRWTTDDSCVVHRLSSIVITGTRLPPIYTEDATAPDNIRQAMARLRATAVARAPEALFAIAGVLALTWGAPEPEARRDALRAFRWFVFEPLMFVSLIRWLDARNSARQFSMSAPITRRLLVAFVVGGGLVGLWAVVQAVGAALAPPLILSDPPIAATADVIGGMQRVSSVYGNPNNLGLSLGRVWPLAAALAMYVFRELRLDFKASPQSNASYHKPHLLAIGFWVLCTLFCLAGILVSFSRGAWLGVGAALIVLVLPSVRRWFGGRLLPGALVVGAALALVAALVVALRGGFMGGSSNVRILFWRESLALIERHPFGLGLDQFFYYHHPTYGRSLIDPSLISAADRDARQPHNLLLELWLNLGPLGLLAVAWLLIRGFKRARAAIRHAPAAPATSLILGAAAALAAALVHGAVDTFYFWPDLALTLWLLLALIEHTPVAEAAASAADKLPARTRALAAGARIAPPDLLPDIAMASMREARTGRSADHILALAAEDSQTLLGRDTVDT